MLKTILVVEDNSTMRDLLRLHLTAAGYAVSAVANGVEAAAAVRGVTPDLIITDVFMSPVGGYEMVARLREDPRMQDMPVIFLTIDEGGFDRAKELGAVAYLKKPIRVEELLSAVATHLPA